MSHPRTPEIEAAERAIVKAARVLRPVVAMTFAGNCSCATCEAARSMLQALDTLARLDAAPAAEGRR